MDKLKLNRKNTRKITCKMFISKVVVFLCSSEQKKVNFQRRSKLLELKSFAEKYELNSFEAVKKLG